MRKNAVDGFRRASVLTPRARYRRPGAKAKATRASRGEAGQAGRAGRAKRAVALEVGSDSEGDREVSALLPRSLDPRSTSFFMCATMSAGPQGTGAR